MPSKKKKYNARFPAGRIKKIMQTDEEIGKVAQAVPVIISRTLELFVKSLLTKAMQVTNAKNAKTLSPSHMKQCILSENRFDFLKDLVQLLPDVSVCDEEGPSLPVCDNKIPPLVPLERQNSSSGAQVTQDSRCIPSPEVTQPQTPPGLPFRRNPNFYTETPEHQLMGVNYTSSVRPSSTAVPQFPLSQIPKGGPLIVDEDYDSVE